MFLSFFLLLIAIFLGYRVTVYFLRGRISGGDAFLISVVIGLTLTAYSVLILSLIFRDLKTAVYVFLFLGGFAAFLKTNVKKALGKIREYTLPSLSTLKEKFFKKAKKISWIEVILVFLMLILFLDLFSKTLVFQDGSYRVAGAGFGDIPFHMTQVSYFINNQPFGLENPIYSGDKLAYPFLINLLSAIFYVLSNNYIFSFQFPAALFICCGILLFYVLITKVVKKAFARICAFFIFFLGSGLGFIKILNDNTIFHQKNLFSYLLHLPYPIVIFYNAHYPDQNITWSSFLTEFLMHQRSFFFGFSLGVLCLLSIYLAYVNKRRNLFIFSGILIGLLPLAHIHSFIALSIIVGGFFLTALIKKNKELVLSFLWMGAISVLVALPALLFILLNKAKSDTGFFIFRWGWMTEIGGIGSINFNLAAKDHTIEYLSYFGQNFGLILPLFIIAAAFLLLRLRRNLFSEKTFFVCSLVFSAALLWIFINTVKFQPWDFDTNKFFGYFLLVAVLIIGYFFDRLKIPGVKIGFVVLTLFIVSTGMIDALSRSSLAHPYLYQIFGLDEQKTADWIINNVSQKNIILTGGNHLNLVNSLAGKPVLMGYAGWLWTHGINYQEREKDIKNIYEGGEATKDLLKKYDIAYVFIGPHERNDYNVDEQFFEQKYPIIFQADSIKIYKVAEK